VKSTVPKHTQHSGAPCPLTDGQAPVICTGLPPPRPLLKKSQSVKTGKSRRRHENKRRRKKQQLHPHRNAHLSDRRTLLALSLISRTTCGCSVHHYSSYSILRRQNTWKEPALEQCVSLKLWSHTSSTLKLISVCRSPSTSQQHSRRDGGRVHDPTIQHNISKAGWWIEVTNTKPHRVERVSAHPCVPLTTVPVYRGPCSFSENLSTLFSQKKITHFCCLLLDNIRSSTETLQWKSTKKLCWRHLPAPYDIMNSDVVLM
jgi:hypothetical protein